VGKGLTIAKVTMLEQVLDPKGHTYAIMLNQSKTGVDVREVQTDEAAVSKLKAQRSSQKAVAAVASFGQV